MSHQNFQMGLFVTCVPCNFMANWRVPKFSLNNCAQSSKKTFMCPKFSTNPVLKYTQCHISTNLSNFLKLCLLYCQTLFALAPTRNPSCASVVCHLCARPLSFFITMAEKLVQFCILRADIILAMIKLFKTIFLMTKILFLN